MEDRKDNRLSDEELDLIAGGVFQKSDVKAGFDWKQFLPNSVECCNYIVHRPAGETWECPNCHTVYQF